MNQPVLVIFQCQHLPIYESSPTLYDQRKYNAKVYATFREETCLRYLARFFLDGSLNKEIGHNAQEQCAKVPGVPHLASQVSTLLELFCV